MAAMKKEIFVYENWSSDTPSKIGTLYVDYTKGKETFSFEYQQEWIKDNSGLVIDPDISTYFGRQFVPPGKRIFGVFADSCPDRWGRVLMKRREAINARAEGRKPKELLESDFLLGVYDKSRMGALRFCINDGGPFLSDEKEAAVPPWASLRTLEEASRAFEKDENSLEEKWLKQLIGPGSSLGGARPKATVQDTDGLLWIAKFPSKHDEVNSGAWEMVAHDLAKLCGLDVPDAKLECFSKLGGTFLVKRFDRMKEKRIHFASAMTMLGKTDGEQAADGVGYLDIAAFIKSNGALPKHDLTELWKRIVFNMAISNADDHLRNHGFLLSGSGWRLSPMYDTNPVPYGDTLSLNIDENDNTISVYSALATAQYYQLSDKEAKELLKELLSIEKGFISDFADLYNLSKYKDEIVAMEGFGEKSYARLIASIEESRSIPFNKFLRAIDIPLLGRHASKIISDCFGGCIDSFEKAVFSNEPYDFTILEGIGGVLQQNIYEWFDDEENLSVWNKLKAIMNFKIKQEEKNIMSKKLEGKTVVVTGKVEEYSRNEMDSLIVSNGGIAAGSVTKNTDYLVIAEKPGASKVNKAKEIGTKTMTAEEFLELLEVK